MMGNYQVRFLGGKGAAMPPTYPINKNEKGTYRTIEKISNGT